MAVDEEAMLLALPTSSFMEPLEPRKQVYSSPQQGHHFFSIFLSRQSSAHSSIPNTEMRPRRLADPQAGTQHSASVSSHTPPAQIHSPSPVTASAVLCGHPVNTWSAGGRPPCRYTCPHYPGQSCTPASSPRGWWATPRGGQVGKGTGREQENEGENEGGWRLGARG